MFEGSFTVHSFSSVLEFGRYPLQERGNYNSVAQREFIPKVMPCLLLYISDPVIMEQLFANAKPRERWQCTGKAMKCSEQRDKKNI